MALLAPAKLNLGLYVGRKRADRGGLHELRSIFCPLELGDRIEIFPAEGDEDEVVCEAVEGPNLAATALDELRAHGWDREPLRVEIEKRIPVSAGLGGGSADAAAVLRLARGELAADVLHEIAAGLGSDVPSQLEPALCLVSGTGERIEVLPAPGDFGCVVVSPPCPGVGAGEAYGELDRISPGRPADELDALLAELRAAAVEGASPLDYAPLLINDLQPAVTSLRPVVAETLSALEQAGAVRAMVSGSGPTAVGLFETRLAAERAIDGLAPAAGSAVATGPLLTSRAGS